MDRKVFMTFDDFAKINTELLVTTDLSLYRSESYEHAFVGVDKVDNAAWADSKRRALALLIGPQSAEAQILGRLQRDVARQDKVGFVNVRYGGDDEFAIGATLYLADGSDTNKLVSRELNKLLKKHARKGVVNSDGQSGKYYDNYYWTDAALASGKHWTLFLGTGVSAPKNKLPGYRPKS